MSRLLELHATIAPAPRAAGASGPGDAAPAGGPFHAGDVALLTLQATIDGDGEVRWPSRDELQKTLEKQAAVLAEGQDVAARDALGTGHAVARTWPVQLLLPPGEGSVGPVPLVLAGKDGAELDKGDVPAATVTVETVLEPELASRLDQQQAAADMKAEMTKQLSAPRGPWAVQSRWPLGTIALALLGVAVLALLLWRLSKRKRPVAPPPPPEPAEVVARRRLSALEASGLLGRGEHLAFHVELADILKQYLSQRLGTDITELTTEEVRRMLRGEIRAKAALALGATSHAGEVRNDILRVLTSCDVVKFARHVPPPATSLELVATVRKIVDLTTTDLPAMEQATAPAAPLAGAAR